jgi:hypothetical protein
MSDKNNIGKEIAKAFSDAYEVMKSELFEFRNKAIQEHYDGDRRQYAKWRSQLPGDDCKCRRMLEWTHLRVMFLPEIPPDDSQTNLCLQTG